MKTLYWGYIDIFNKIHVKRYTDDRRIRNAQDSGTTTGIFDPFFANSIAEAMTMCLEKYREVLHFDKQVKEKKQ